MRGLELDEVRAQVKFGQLEAEDRPDAPPKILQYDYRHEGLDEVLTRVVQQSVRPDMEPHVWRKGCRHRFGRFVPFDSLQLHLNQLALVGELQLVQREDCAEAA